MSASKLSPAEKDWVQMISPARMSETAVRTTMASTTIDSRLDA